MIFVKRLASARWVLVAAATAVLALVVFLFYFAVYPLRQLSLPLGFDTPWYVWRAEFVAHERIGPIGTSVRPGHALLSALLGSVGGLSQIEVAALFPLVLTSVFALSMGALAWAGLGPDRWRWAAVIALAGAVLATTRLPGENVANLLNLLLIVGAVMFLCSWATDHTGFWGAVLLLFASGLAHPLFLAVFGAILALAALAAAPSSLRQSRAGAPLLHTETGALVAAGGAAAALLGVTFAWVLGPSLQTFQGIDDRKRFLPKLRNDLLRVAFLTPAGLAGAALLSRVEAGADAAVTASRRRRFALRMLASWTAVCLGGLLYALVTTRLPPHRLLALIVAVPGAFALAATATFVSRWVRRRPGRDDAKSRSAAVAATALTVAVLAIPGAVAWYSQGPRVWIERSALQQARIAGAYVSGLRPGQPVVFLIDPSGRAGTLSAALKERTIRAGLPAERVRDAHFFVGALPDLLHRRRTPAASSEMNRATLSYWQDVRSVLAPNTPTLILRATAPESFREAVREGASVVGPGVALVRGPLPDNDVLVAPRPIRVPGLPRALYEAALLLSLLAIAGTGWSLALLPSHPPEVILPITPVVGAAVLMVAALLANLAGVAFTRPAAVVIHGALTLAGAVLAGALGRLRASNPRRSGLSSEGS